MPYFSILMMDVNMSYDILVKLGYFIDHWQWLLQSYDEYTLIRVLSELVGFMDI